MQQVLRQDASYWNNKNIETCFVDCLRNLKNGLKNRWISDIFFPQVTTTTTYIHVEYLLFLVQHVKENRDGESQRRNLHLVRKAFVKI